jgi:hypothetical protein
MELWLDQTIPVQEYLMDALEFLVSPEAESFLYREERTRYFFDLIERNASALLSDVERQLKAAARRRKWFRRALHSAGLFRRQS